MKHHATPNTTIIYPCKVCHKLFMVTSLKTLFGCCIFIKPCTHMVNEPSLVLKGGYTWKHCESLPTSIPTNLHMFLNVGVWPSLLCGRGTRVHHIWNDDGIMAIFIYNMVIHKFSIFSILTRRFSCWNNIFLVGLID
jgi:hypothetical protein